MTLNQTHKRGGAVVSPQCYILLTNSTVSITPKVQGYSTFNLLDWVQIPETDNTIISIVVGGSNPECGKRLFCWTF